MSIGNNHIAMQSHLLKRQRTWKLDYTALIGDRIRLNMRRRGEGKG